MIQVSSDILSLTSEALILSRAGKISFANAPAKEILGADCVNKSLKYFFEPGITGSQASSFIADTIVRGKHYIVRVSKQTDMLVMFLTNPPAEPVLLNDAFIYSLRSALMTMSFSVDMCRSRAEALNDAGLQENIASLTKSYYQLSRLVSNVSVAQGVIRGEMSFTPVRLDLTECCINCVEGVEMFCKKPEIVVNAAPKMYVTADPMLVEQVLLNLLSNSLVHGKDCTRISISLIDAGESVILSVSDDGCGIESDMLHSVFDRYVHGFDMRGMSGGAGLGLTVGRGIAEKHGGTLLLESRPGRGTTVRISLRKNLKVPLNLRTNEGEYSGGAKSVLMGLADYLPAECYADKYMD